MTLRKIITHAYTINNVIQYVRMSSERGDDSNGKTLMEEKGNDGGDCDIFEHILFFNNFDELRVSFAGEHTHTHIFIFTLTRSYSTLYFIFIYHYYNNICMPYVSEYYNDRTIFLKYRYT